MPIAMLSTSLLTNPQKYGRFNALDTENPFATKPGMVLMKPTSITHSGTSATLGANGQVTFTAVTELNINGCFTADFDNYFISWNATADANRSVLLVLRASGADATGTDYTVQYIVAESTTLTAARDTSEVRFAVGNSSTVSGAAGVNVYGPHLAQPTAVRENGTNAINTGRLTMYAGTHSLSTSYDGFTFKPNGGGNMTGALAVYGVRS